MKTTHIIVQRAAYEPQTIADWIGYVLGIGITAVALLIALFMIFLMVDDICSNFDWYDKLMRKIFG